MRYAKTVTVQDVIGKRKRGRPRKDLKNGKEKISRRKNASVRALRSLREAVLDFLHSRKGSIVIVECTDKYVIVAKKIKVVTTEIANSEGFQPVERVTESVKIVLAIIAIYDDLSKMKKKMSNLLCRQLIHLGCPVFVVKSEEDINKLGG